jgi:hypothetical protein
LADLEARITAAMPPALVILGKDSGPEQRAAIAKAEAEGRLVLVVHVVDAATPEPAIAGS